MIPGPRDSSLLGPDPERLDLGCLRIKLVKGVEVRVDLDEESHVPTKVSLNLGHSVVTLEAFAAPRHEDMWPTERDGIAAKLEQQGITSNIVMGRFGTELVTVMPSINYDGSPIVHSVRFVGIDGPRWFLRAVVSGDGAIEGFAHEQVDEAIADLVVHRGDNPMAPGEALPITMPEEP